MAPSSRSSSCSICTGRACTRCRRTRDLHLAYSAALEGRLAPAEPRRPTSSATCARAAMPSPMSWHPPRRPSSAGSRLRRTCWRPSRRGWARGWRTSAAPAARPTGRATLAARRVPRLRPPLVALREHERPARLPHAPAEPMTHAQRDAPPRRHHLAALTSASPHVAAHPHVPRPRHEYPSSTRSRRRHGAGLDRLAGRHITRGPRRPRGCA